MLHVHLDRGHHFRGFIMDGGRHTTTLVPVAALPDGVASTRGDPREGRTFWMREDQLGQPEGHGLVSVAVEGDEIVAQYGPTNVREMVSGYAGHCPSGSTYSTVGTGRRETRPAFERRISIPDGVTVIEDDAQVEPGYYMGCGCGRHLSTSFPAAPRAS